MMHQTIAILQEQHEEQLLLQHPQQHPQQHQAAVQQQHEYLLEQQPSRNKAAPVHFDPQQQQQQQPSHNRWESAERSLSQRLWRFVRENVLTQPRRKVRSASYSPQGSATLDERPRDNKRRARSCGHAAEQPRTPGSRIDSSAARASATIANAWRKSKMLQELEASTERDRGCCVLATAVKHGSGQLTRHSAQQQQQQQHRVRVSETRYHSARRTCRNCAQPYFALNTLEHEDAANGAGFCSLDCRSSFEYLATMQRFVDVRIDEADSGDEKDAAAWGTTL